MEPANRSLHAVALDETHCVKWPAIGVRSKPIDRHNSWMFETASNLRFSDKTRAEVLLKGMLRLNLLESYLAVEFLVVSDENLSQPATRMRPQDAEAASREIRRTLLLWQGAVRNSVN